MLRTSIILFAHGSRDPDWAAPFHAIRRKLEGAQPQLRVELAFLENMRPSLAEAASALAAASERVMIAPLFMSQGAHLKRDLAKLLGDVRAEYPTVRFELLPSVGEIDAVLNAISASIGHAASRLATP
jgi:sirohydrochlorin cobaltochelatase